MPPARMIVWMTRFATVHVALVLLVLACAPAAARDRGAAREAFKKAVEYHNWLKELPAQKRTLSQYRQGIFLYRSVIDKDPTYGGCDDALFAIASLYEDSGRNLDRPSDLQRAAYYYEFVAREYPTTRYRDTALKRASEIRNPTPGPVPQSPAPVSAETTPRNAGNGGKRGSATLSEVRYWSNEDYTRVVLQLDREIEFSKSVLANPDRIYFDLDSTQVDPSLVNHSYEVNGLFIKRIRVGENRPEVTRVVLDFDRISQHTVFALYDPYRIVIDTRGASYASSQAASPAPDLAPRPVPTPLHTAEAADPVEAGPESTVVASPAPDAEGVTSASPTIQGNWTLTRTLGLKVGRVVIDPGHGGKDTGTIGPTGLREKDLVLDVALRLKELLVTRLGVDVILTRSTDRFIPLEERTAIANQTGADLFISIHANASRNRRAYGIETYVLDFATTPAEIEIASRENAGSQRNIRELEDLLRQIAKGDFNKESRDLAQTVQTRLVSGLHTDAVKQIDRGVKQAPFIVLIGSNMPSILTEIGFISNPDHERFYKTQEGRNLAAESLYQGIEAYFQALGVTPPPHAVSATHR